MIRVGTAGWAAPRTVRDRFPEAESGLARYAGRFDCAEINSTFYRSHKPSTYARWVEQTPDGFRFALKIPKTITHERRLADSDDLLEAFLAEAALLGDKLGPLLVQLPPSAALDSPTAEAFFRSFRSRFDGAVACEPRHPTWFEADAEALLREHRIARVAADPARVPAAAEPGGWDGLKYWRLHGSPRMYWSSYEPAWLAELAARLRAAPAEAWCIFDNTTSGAAAANALDLLEQLD
ncbi:DUF72 domain-containing protein [Phenylobacterium sp.]|jgi:uncharacterized protein YecE (DUF72 family)|uniref:DUF72 domain-containing protein n=1 Tax=Phenylobacterium sp. TaxID=1871053 RepID=UPI002F939AF0